MGERINWPLIIAGGILTGLVIVAVLAVLLFYASPGAGVRVPPKAIPEKRPASNGELIYFTGVNAEGKRIPFTGGPPWLYMHGGGCASCHGEDGRGGYPVMMVTAIPPDIRYSHLTEESEEHPPYTDELIKRAITKGLDPAGKPLDPAMPRWQMSEEDLNDLLDFLKMLK